jgi:hypothetical protein
MPDLDDLLRELEKAQRALESIQVVAWRYQRKEGWGDVWRVADILPTFEAPEHWVVEALGVIGSVEPESTGKMVRHDIEADRGPLDTGAPRLLDTRGFAADEPLIFDLGEGVRRAADVEPKPK